MPFNKNQVIVNKDTFDTMVSIVKESKKVIELQPKIQELFSGVNHYTKSHQALEKQNRNLQSIIKNILERIKIFFRNILLKGNDKLKDLVTEEVKDYYDYGDFEQQDIIDVAYGTTKEDELVMFQIIINLIMKLKMILI